jgi:hypothetical protein
MYSIGSVNSSQLVSACVPLLSNEERTPAERAADVLVIVIAKLGVAFAVSQHIHNSRTTLFLAVIYTANSIHEKYIAHCYKLNCKHTTDYTIVYYK